MQQTISKYEQAHNILFQGSTTYQYTIRQMTCDGPTIAINKQHLDNMKACNAPNFEFQHCAAYCMFNFEFYLNG